MRLLRTLFIAVILVFLFTVNSSGKGPNGKDFGFGLIIGDPLGLTIKSWLNNENAFDIYVGSSYFGSIRIGADYLWHFDVFNSRVVNMYAGPGIAFGFGRGRGVFNKEDKSKFYYWNDNAFGMGVRAICGINVIPKRTPIELFFE